MRGARAGPAQGPGVMASWQDSCSARHAKAGTKRALTWRNWAC